MGKWTPYFFLLSNIPRRSKKKWWNLFLPSHLLRASSPIHLTFSAEANAITFFSYIYPLRIAEQKSKKMFIGEFIRSWRFFETGACCRQDFWLFCWPQKDGKTRCGREKYLAFWQVVKGRMCDGLSWSWPCYNFSKIRIFGENVLLPLPPSVQKNAKKLEEFPQRNSGIRILLFFLGGCRRKPLKKKEVRRDPFFVCPGTPTNSQIRAWENAKKKRGRKKWGKRGWGGGKKWRNWRLRKRRQFLHCRDGFFSGGGEGYQLTWLL